MTLLSDGRRLVMVDADAVTPGVPTAYLGETTLLRLCVGGLENIADAAVDKRFIRIMDGESTYMVDALRSESPNQKCLEAQWEFLTRGWANMQAVIVSMSGHEVNGPMMHVRVLPQIAANTVTEPDDVDVELNQDDCEVDDYLLDL